MWRQDENQVHLEVVGDMIDEEDSDIASEPTQPARAQ